MYIQPLAPAIDNSNGFGTLKPARSLAGIGLLKSILDFRFIAESA